MKRYVDANNKLAHAVQDLVDTHRLLQLQDQNLELAIADGNAIVFEDWHAAIKAVAAASIAFDAAEHEVEGSK
jgi:hypothetical protein